MRSHGGDGLAVCSGSDSGGDICYGCGSEDAGDVDAESDAEHRAIDDCLHGHVYFPPWLSRLAAAAFQGTDRCIIGEAWAAYDDAFGRRYHDVVRQVYHQNSRLVRVVVAVHVPGRLRSQRRSSQKGWRF